MKKKTMNTILDRLDAIINEDVRVIQDDEFTLQDYLNQVKKNGLTLTTNQAYRRLMARVESGEMTVRKSPLGKGSVNVFKFTKP